MSGPISPVALELKKGIIRTELYNWIYLSVWFGLRPKEVDNLHEENFWRVEKLWNGRRVLWVYQTKVIALPEEDRWKPIPILYAQQEEGLNILNTNNFKRPWAKTVRFHFGKDVTLYGGRKGFTDLMLAKGHTIENISIWMGHSTINRTWKSYKNRRKYHIQYTV
jgi:integrase